MNDSAHLMTLKRKLKKKNNTPLNRLCMLPYMYSLFASETNNNHITKRKQASFTSVKGAIFMQKIKKERTVDNHEKSNYQAQQHNNWRK